MKGGEVLTTEVPEGMQPFKTDAVKRTELFTISVVEEIPDKNSRWHGKTSIRTHSTDNTLYQARLVPDTGQVEGDSDLDALYDTIEIENAPECLGDAGKFDIGEKSIEHHLINNKTTTQECSSFSTSDSYSRDRDQRTTDIDIKYKHPDDMQDTKPLTTTCNAGGKAIELSCNYLSTHVDGCCFIKQDPIVNNFAGEKLSNQGIGMNETERPDDRMPVNINIRPQSLAWINPASSENITQKTAYTGVKPSGVEDRQKECHVRVNAGDEKDSSDGESTILDEASYQESEHTDEDESWEGEVINDTDFSGDITATPNATSDLDSHACNSMLTNGERNNITPTGMSSRSDPYYDSEPLKRNATAIQDNETNTKRQTKSKLGKTHNKPRRNSEKKLSLFSALDIFRQLNSPNWQPMVRLQRIEIPKTPTITGVRDATTNLPPGGNNEAETLFTPDRKPGTNHIKEIGDNQQTMSMKNTSISPQSMFETVVIRKRCYHQCRFCKKLFYTKECLEKHLTKHNYHKDEPDLTNLIIPTRNDRSVTGPLPKVNSKWNALARLKGLHFLLEHEAVDLKLIGKSSTEKTNNGLLGQSGKLGNVRRVAKKSTGPRRLKSLPVGGLPTETDTRYKTGEPQRKPVRQNQGESSEKLGNVRRVAKKSTGPKRLKSPPVGGLSIETDTRYKTGESQRKTVGQNQGESSENPSTPGREDQPGRPVFKQTINNVITKTANDTEERPVPKRSESRKNIDRNMTARKKQLQPGTNASRRNRTGHMSKIASRITVSHILPAPHQGGAYMQRAAAKVASKGFVAPTLIFRDRKVSWRPGRKGHKQESQTGQRAIKRRKLEDVKDSSPSGKNIGSSLQKQTSAMVDARKIHVATSGSSTPVTLSYTEGEKGGQNASTDTGNTAKSLKTNNPGPVLNKKQPTEQMTSGQKQKNIITKKRKANREFAVNNTDNANGETSNDLRPHSCSICQRAFKDKWKMRKHEKEVHSSRRPFRCHICGTRMKRKSALKQHMLAHTRGAVFACDICGRKFNQKYYLKGHMWTHVTEKNFKCATCGRKFVSEMHMKKHIDRMHISPTVYKCDICQETFLTRFDRRIHEAGHKVEGNGDENNAKGDENQKKADKHQLHVPDEIRHKGMKRTRESSKINNNSDTSTMPQNENRESAETTRSVSVGKQNPKHMATRIKATESRVVESQRRGQSISRRDDITKVGGETEGFLCEQCGKRLDSPRGLEDHQRTDACQQGRDEQYTCDVCKKTYSDATSLESHQLIHAGQALFKCGVCDKAFTNSANLVKHVRIHTGERPYSCPHCQLSFRNKSYLAIHITVHTGETPFKCNDCGQRFRLLIKLRAHQVTEHGAPHPFKCATCGRGFMRLYLLTYHERIHTGEKPFKCVKCGNFFRTKSQLKAHMTTHANKMKYGCNVCKERFSSSQMLQGHTQTHKEECQHKCPHCDKRFAEYANLRHHVRSHTDARPYKCDLCPMSFVAPDRLKCHRRSHEKERPYKCPICSKGFSTSSALAQHKRIHSAERPHVCQETGCSAKFITAVCLRRHMLIHNGQMPYQCQCGSKHRYSQGLKKHKEQCEARKTTA